MRSSWLWLGLLATGCGDDLDPDAPPVGDVHQYVVGGVHLPSNNASARELSLDVNGDTKPDNNLGMVFATLQSMGFDIAGTADESLLRGNAIMLAELQTTSFLDSELAGFTTYLGASPDPAACLDPQDLSTCGQHLATRAHYEIRTDGSSSLATDIFVDGTLFAAVDRLPIELSIDEAGPIRIDLRIARIKLTNMSAGGGSAILAGGIPQDDIATGIVPAAARQLTRIVSTECSRPSETERCRCPSSSRARTLQELFDANGDCEVATAEVRDNAIVQSLLRPDLRFGDDQFLSFGFGVDLVPASF